MICHEKAWHKSLLNVSDHAAFISSRPVEGSSACTTPTLATEKQVSDYITVSTDNWYESSDPPYPKSSSRASSAQGQLLSSALVSATDNNRFDGTTPKSDPTWKRARRSSKIPRFRRTASYRTYRRFGPASSSVKSRKTLGSDGNTTDPRSSTSGTPPPTTPSSPLRDNLFSTDVFTFNAFDDPSLVFTLTAAANGALRPSPTVRTLRGEELRRVNINNGVRVAVATVTTGREDWHNQLTCPPTNKTAEDNHCLSFARSCYYHCRSALHWCHAMVNVRILRRDCMLEPIGCSCLACL